MRISDWSSDVCSSDLSGDIRHTLQFTSLDWSILIGYVLILAIAGYASTRRNMQNADDYFLASHRAPTWLVAVSVLSTVQSTATFLGVPDNKIGRASGRVRVCQYVSISVVAGSLK